MAQTLEADRPSKYASIDSNTLYSQVQANTLQSGTSAAQSTVSNPQSLAALVSKPGRGRGGRGGGMQSIGKLSVNATRRTTPKPPLPVNLPSEKSEQIAASSADSGSWSGPGPAQSSQTPPPSDAAGASQTASWRPSNASARPSQAGGRGDRFSSRDFPELGASGGLERPPGPPRSTIPEAAPPSRPSLPDEGPVLKPHSVGNWRDGGGGRAPPHLPQAVFRPEPNRDTFGPISSLRDEGPEDSSRMPFMGTPIGPEPPWMGPPPRMLPPGAAIMGPGGPSFAPPWIRGPPPMPPFGPPPPMFRAPRPQVIIPPSYRNRMSRPPPQFMGGGPPPPFERPFSIERDRPDEGRQSELDWERERFRRYEKRANEPDSSHESDRERSPPRSREYKRPDRAFSDKENQNENWKEREEADREPRQRSAEEASRADAERARKELELAERKRERQQAREKAIEEKIKREGWAAVTTDEVDYDEQLSFGSDDEGEREARERPDASPRDSRTSADHRALVAPDERAAEDRARALAISSRSEQSLKRPPSTRSEHEAPSSDARRFEPGEQPPSARFRADTEQQARMRSAEQQMASSMASSQDVRRFADDRRHDLREPPSMPPRAPQSMAAPGPGAQSASAQPKPFALDPASHLQPQPSHASEMQNQAAFQNFPQNGQWYRDNLGAFEPQGPMQGFPFQQMPGAFPERPFGFQPPPQSQVFKPPPSFGDSSSNPNAAMNFFSVEPPAFPSEPIFGQPATNRAHSNSEADDQLSAHLKRAQQRKEEKYRQGLAAARDHDASSPPAAAPTGGDASLDFQLQGSQFAHSQMPLTSQPSMRTRVLSGGGELEAQDETAVSSRRDMGDSPAYSQGGWLPMRPAAAPPTMPMPSFGEPSSHSQQRRQAPFPASEEPAFKVSAWNAEPGAGAHGRPTKAERAQANRGPKAGSPTKVVSLLSLDLKPPPSLMRNLGHKYAEAGDVEGDTRWHNEDDGAGTCANDAYEGALQASGEEFPQVGHPESGAGDASAPSRGMWATSSSATALSRGSRRGGSRTRGGSRGTDAYSSRNAGALALERSGGAGLAGRRAPRATLNTGSSGVVGALGLEGGPAWQRRGGSRSGRPGTRSGVRRSGRSARSARGTTEKTSATESPQDSPNKNEQPSSQNQAAPLGADVNEEGVEEELDRDGDGDRDEWETASESSNVARHSRVNRSADSSPAPADIRSSGSARNLNLRGSGKITVTVPGPAAAAANARRTERNLNNIDLNDISRVVVVESLPDNVVSHETGDTDEGEFIPVTHKRGKAARAAAAAKNPPPAPAVPATSIPSLLTLQTAPVFTSSSAAGTGTQPSKRQAHAKSAPQQERVATARAMSEPQDTAAPAFVDDSRTKWNGDSGDDITIGVIDHDQPTTDLFKPPSVDHYPSNTVLSKNYSVSDQFAAVGAQPTGSLFGESSALFPSLGSPSQPSGSSYSDTHKSNMFPGLNLDNEEFASQYLPSGLGGTDSVLQFPYSSPPQSSTAPATDMAINFGYLEEQQRDALRMPSPNKVDQQRGAGAAAAGAPRQQTGGYFDSRPEGSFNKGSSGSVDTTSSAAKSGPFGAMGAASAQQAAAAASEQQRAKQQHSSGSGDPEASRQTRQAPVASPGSTLHAFDHHYPSSSHDPSLDSLQHVLWNSSSFASAPPNSDFLPASPLFASDSAAQQRFARETDLSKPFAAMNINEAAHAARPAKQPAAPLETQRVSEALNPHLPASNAAPVASPPSAPSQHLDASTQLHELLLSSQFRDIFNANPAIIEMLLQRNISFPQLLTQISKLQAANDAAASKGAQTPMQPTESSSSSGGIHMEDRTKDIQTNAPVSSKPLPQWNENQQIGSSSAPSQPPALPPPHNVQPSMPSGVTSSNSANASVVRQMATAESTFSTGQSMAADSSRDTVLASPPQPPLLGPVLTPVNAGLFGAAGFVQAAVAANKSDQDQAGSALSLTQGASLSLTTPQPLGYGLSAMNLGSVGAPSWNPLFNPHAALNASLQHPSLAISGFSARPTPPPAVASMNRSFGAPLVQQQSQQLASLQQQPATSPPLQQSLPTNMNQQLSSLLSQVNKPMNPMQLGPQQRGSLSGLPEQRPQQALSGPEMQLWPGNQYELANLNLLMTNRYQSSLPLVSTDTGNGRWPSGGMTTWSTPSFGGWQGSNFAPPQQAGLLQPFAAPPTMPFAAPPGLLAGAGPAPGSNAQLAGSGFMQFGLAPPELQLQSGARPALSSTTPFRPARYPPPPGVLPTSS